ncbi:transposon Ty3-I Gag-Pol polyprotein [Caerostris extrusa]|uniref:Transposon Ty3-I Gag-Pol polyprotein n=1 Tax=Caerostris extrusa TaxID=172846 RepID=A0AAV4PHY5_CAEEX|nr:transposon Ty3-I Gag-Pol polyprotein [Caerostris extrusa]
MEKRIKDLVDSSTDYSSLSEKLRYQLKASMFAEDDSVLKTALQPLNETRLELLRTTFAIIDKETEELRLTQILPVDTQSRKSDCSLFTASDYPIAPNSMKQICVINPEIEETNKTMVIGNKILLHKKELWVPASIIDVQNGNGNRAQIKQKPYHVSIAERRVIEDEVRWMRKEGVKLSSDNPWSSSIVLLKKKMKVIILDHLVDEHGIYPDPEKVTAVTNSPVPVKVANVRNVLVFAHIIEGSLKTSLITQKPCMTY